MYSQIYEQRLPVENNGLCSQVVVIQRPISIRIGHLGIQAPGLSLQVVFIRR